MDNLTEAIRQLKKEKNAIILGHYYQKGEIQDIADYVGDSLALAQWAARTDADIIVMCGVHFMGETAKVLCPDKKVLVPDILCEHDGCRKGCDRCRGDFYQRKANCGKFPEGRENHFRTGSEFGKLHQFCYGAQHVVVGRCVSRARTVLG